MAASTLDGNNLELLVQEARDVGVAENVITAIEQIEALGVGYGIPSLQEAIKRAKINIDYPGLFIRLNGDIVEPLYNLLAETYTRLDQFNETHRIALKLDVEAPFESDDDGDNDDVNPLTLLFTKTKRSRGSGSRRSSTGQKTDNDDAIAMAKALIAQTGVEPEVIINVKGENARTVKGTLHETGEVTDDQDGKTYPTISLWMRIYLAGGNPYKNTLVVYKGNPVAIDLVVREGRAAGWLPTPTSDASNGHEDSADLSQLADLDQDESMEEEEQKNEEVPVASTPPPVASNRAPAPRRVKGTFGTRA